MDAMPSVLQKTPRERRARWRFAGPGALTSCSSWR